MTALQFHPLADIFPLIDGDEFDALIQDISANGLQEPIVLFEGQILDGRNRYRACEAAGVSCQYRIHDGTNPAAYVVSLNLQRRHLSESQRAMVADKLANLNHGQRKSPIGDSAMTQAEAADMLNVGKRSVERAKEVRDHGVPELQDSVEQKRVSVSAAADIATLAKSEQLIVVARGKKEIQQRAKEIRTDKADKKRAERTKRLVELSNQNAPLPQDRKYPIIYADPPWQYDFSPSDDRSVENHYPTMSIEDIWALQVADLTTPDAMLFLWAPPSFIKKGIMTLEAWGFELATSLVWVKDRIGTGIYVRQRHEFLLLGKRGQPITPRPGSQPDSVIESPRNKHSAKPEIVYDLIGAMYPDLPRIELFARQGRDDWDAWGNQAEGR